jgi:hypothetical protein
MGEPVRPGKPPRHPGTTYAAATTTVRIGRRGIEDKSERDRARRVVERAGMSISTDVPPGQQFAPFDAPG